MLASDSRGGYQPTNLNSYSNMKNQYEREPPTQNSYGGRQDVRRQAPQPEEYPYGGGHGSNYGKSSTTEHQHRGKMTMDYSMPQQPQRQPARQSSIQQQIR